jgi:lactoylglutathione lyase
VAEDNLLMDVPATHTGYTHMALEVTDGAAVKEQLDGAVIPITETVELPGGAVFFFVRDPDGNVIEFNQPGAAAQ